MKLVPRPRKQRISRSCRRESSRRSGWGLAPTRPLSLRISGYGEQLRLAWSTGLEPATSGVTGLRANQNDAASWGILAGAHRRISPAAQNQSIAASVSAGNESDLVPPAARRTVAILNLHVRVKVRLVREGIPITVR